MTVNIIYNQQLEWTARENLPVTAKVTDTTEIISAKATETLMEKLTVTVNDSL